MDSFILLTTFAGSWLIVVGPLLQASLELSEASRQTRDNTKEGHSRWWWLFPPLMYWVSTRSMDHDSAVARAYRRRATGWFAVARGGALLAFGPTHEVSSLLRLGIVGFFALYASFFRSMLPIYCNPNDNQLACSRRCTDLAPII
ncbi:hypothetical protein J5O04_10800 [Corynebacterium hindlerae]|uniref:hypothetical protein n=1 Tax=Corynebacterium hindlerae TaxID=699041 RepID=UPI001AD69D74|nr:hypothetical protein [Corynebacterium hindlerae]QTH59277.1 hypothetical protein J5O04_10800 [Corynebacterium hindlerae]